MTNVYKTSADSFSEFVNKSQYFSPFFSFITVFYIYFAIGIRSDTIWKYLFWVVNCGFYANLFSMAKAMSKNLYYYQFDYFKHLVWFETVFFGLNEWGYVYINFIKIRSLIKALKTRFWSLIIYSLLIYTITCRVIISYFELQEEDQKLKGETPQETSVRIHTILYVPMGVIEVIFLYLIIKNITREDDNKSKNILNILLHSSLSRMFIVSLLLLAISVIVWFPNTGVPGFIRRFLWRIKGYLGIIFLVDLLLLRIEIDNSRITDQNEKIKRINLENSIENTTRMYQSAAGSTINSPLNYNNTNYSPSNYSPTNHSPTNQYPYTGPIGSPYSPNRFTENYENSREKLINTPTTPTSRYGIPTSPASKSQIIMTNDRSKHRFNNSTDRHHRRPSNITSMYSSSSVSENLSQTTGTKISNTGEITDHRSETQKFSIYEEAKRLYK